MPAYNNQTMIRCIALALPALALTVSAGAQAATFMDAD
jgi:hypothetical protein